MLLLCFPDDLEINPNHIEKMMRDHTEAIRQSQQERDELGNQLHAAESKLAEKEEEIKRFSHEMKEIEKALQTSERAKERIELQFERTQETIHVQVCCLISI